MDTRKWRQAGLGVIVVLLITALAASAVAGCSAANASEGPLKLGESDNGKAFTVNVGDTIQVVVPGNITTGFSWAAALSEKDAALLMQDGDAVYEEGAADPEVVGAGGTFTFTFTAQEAGTAALTLVYQQPWEKTGAEQTFEVEITIE